MRKKIVITVDWFDPAYRAGGPITSMVNFVNLMHPYFEIQIICGSQDYGNVELEGIKIDDWNNWQDKAQVYYMNSKNLSRRTLFDLLDDTEADFYYIQGLFSLNFSIYPLLWWKKRKIGQGIVAPRGMLHETAIGLKSSKKLTYLSITKFLGWFSDVYFHVTNEFEKVRVLKYFKRAELIRIAPNVPKILNGKVAVLKQSESLKVLMVGRISPEKNYTFLFEIIKEIKFNCVITVVGSFENENYFQTEFNQRITENSEFVKINWIQSLSPSELQKEYQQADVYLTTTLGENYGHSIIEALGNGCPVVAPIEIPWQNLEQVNAGFNLDWEAKLFANTLKYYFDMPTEVFEKDCTSAFYYYKKAIQLEELKEDYKKLFT